MFEYTDLENRLGTIPVSNVSHFEAAAHGSVIVLTSGARIPSTDSPHALRASFEAAFSRFARLMDGRP